MKTRALAVSGKAVHLIDEGNPRLSLCGLVLDTDRDAIGGETCKRCSRIHVTLEAQVEWMASSTGTTAHYVYERNPLTSYCGRALNPTRSIANLARCRRCLHAYETWEAEVKKAESKKLELPANETRGRDGESAAETIARLREQNKAMSDAWNARVATLQRERDTWHNLIMSGKRWVETITGNTLHGAHRDVGMVAYLLQELANAQVERDAFRDRMLASTGYVRWMRSPQDRRSVKYAEREAAVERATIAWAVNGDGDPRDLAARITKELG